MAKTKQFTIVIDNQPGAVAAIARALGDAKVNILSLSWEPPQGTAGSVQFIVDDARRAKKALDAARIAYQETPAEACDLPNKPGALAQCFGETRGQGVNLDSIHATRPPRAVKRPSLSTLRKPPQKRPPPARRSASLLRWFFRLSGAACSLPASAQ